MPWDKLSATDDHVSRTGSGIDIIASQTISFSGGGSVDGVSGIFENIEMRMAYGTYGLIGLPVDSHADVGRVFYGARQIVGLRVAVYISYKEDASISGEGGSGVEKTGRLFGLPYEHAIVECARNTICVPHADVGEHNLDGDIGDEVVVDAVAGRRKRTDGCRQTYGEKLHVSAHDRGQMPCPEAILPIMTPNWSAAF